jgi:hypothetical protein
MATVTSLTATRIEELLAGWESVGLSQDEINSLIVQLGTNVLEQGASLEHFNEVIRPVLEASVADSSLALSDMNDNILPALDAGLATANTELETLLTVTLPSLQTDMDNTLINVAERPNVYVQDDEPENPDENDRDLVVGDTWFGPDDVQRIWNGTEWTTLSIDVADFSLTAQKFKTSRHMLY